jgi:hypothetical protein
MHWMRVELVIENEARAKAILENAVAKGLSRTPERSMFAPSFEEIRIAEPRGFDV